jgi:hypothetical protein
VQFLHSDHKPSFAADNPKQPNPRTINATVLVDEADEPPDLQNKNQLGIEDLENI